MSRSTWLPESTSECTPSASIEVEAVIAKAMNLITAMPRLAPSAAITALDPLPRSQRKLTWSGWRGVDTHAQREISRGEVAES